MKILIINNDYPEYTKWLYSVKPELRNFPYEIQMANRYDTLFGMADFYSYNLKKLGHDAWDLIGNLDCAQIQWAKEHKIKTQTHKFHFRFRRKIIPWISYIRDDTGFLKILEQQIKNYQPDVLLNLAADSLAPSLFKPFKPYTKLLVAQHAASPLDEAEDWSIYDLVISSFQPTLDFFQERNIPAILLKLGFEDSVIQKVSNQEKDIDVSFIGSFGEIHTSRTSLLEYVAERVPLSIWGPEDQYKFMPAKLQHFYKGSAWGADMFKILSRSKLTLNHHGNVPAYANNMRLFEATGMGTLLLTDWKSNLQDLFDPENEVVTYRTQEECCEKITYYLEHSSERDRISQAGQKRTLSDHTYLHRMQEFVQIINNYL
jgi:spore maturation protein CgeB